MFLCFYVVFFISDVNKATRNNTNALRSKAKDKNFGLASLAGVAHFKLKMILLVSASHLISFLGMRDIIK